MSCRPNYDPCLDGKLNQIGSYAAVARSSAQNSAASAEQSEDFSQASAFSAGQSATSASEANNYLTQVTNIFEDFDERYLGAKSVPPTVDNQGNPLQEGALYWNSVSDTMFAWNGTIWVATNFNQLTPFTATGTPIARNLVTRASDWVNVKDFGAVGDGITNDTPFIQAAIDSIGIGGGTVYIPNDMVCLIDTALTIKPHISLVGPNEFIGSASNNAWNNYNEVKGTLIVNPSIAITMQGGSSLNKLLVYRKGMTFPASSALYSGTAITATGDDVSVSHSMILGFNQAFNSVGNQRIKFNFVYLDNQSGINIEACYDIAYMENVHSWPFAGVAIGDAKRTGSAIRMHNGGDWNKISNCFSYGYSRGIVISGCDDVTIENTGADNVNGNAAGSHGFFITGDCRNTKIVNCQTAAQGTSGIYINTNANQKTLISNHTSWGTTGQGVLIDSGDVIITNLTIDSLHQRAINVTNSSSKVIANNVIANSITFLPIDATVPTQEVQVNNLVTSFSGALLSPNINVKTLTASGTVLSIPSYGELFYVDGSNISFIDRGRAGRIITLIFKSSLTINNGGAGNNGIRLQNNTSFTVSANQSITLAHTGVQWFEIARTT